MTKGVALMNPCDKIGSPSTADNGRDKRGEALLLLAACSGNSQAFVELSKPHSRRILLKLHRITKNWQDAEDALQEALMKAFLHLDSFRGNANFSTWFTSIAVNSALMLLRKRRGVLEIAIDNVGKPGTCHEWDLRDSRDNPEQCFERQQRADLIQSGILRLPPELRKVIELQHSRDLSNKEIALCLGISLSATKSRLLRARAALRVFVQREACNPPAGAESVWAKQAAFPINSEDDVKNSLPRRENQNRSNPNAIEHHYVPLEAMSPTWKETIRLGGEEISMVGGR
jgi:RNA polymerase sigma-70 factor (ECF subfamily)